MPTRSPSCRPAATLWATAAGFLVAIVLIAVSGVPASERPEHHERPSGLLRGTLDGLRFFWGDRLLRVLGLVSMVIVALYLPIEAVLLPAWFQAQQAPHLLGAVLMALSLGGITGALAYGQWGGRLGRRVVYLTALIGTALALVVMATLPATPLLLAAAVVIGLLYGPVQPLVSLAAQTRTPPRLRGRVIGVLVASEHAAGPVGYLTAGPATDAVGIRPVFIGLAVAVLAVALCTMLLPSLRQLDDLPDTPPEGDLPAHAPRPHTGA